MKIFFSHLHVEVQDCGRKYLLTKAFHVDYNRTMFIVPRGFVTDFASVPRGLWNIFPPFGRYSKAAVLHDWLYQTGKVARGEADRIFLECMKELGVPAWKRWAMYLGLRVGGWAAWNSYR